MKKTVLIVPALLALAAVSCTKSEVLESNSGEIRFNVVANSATKAADVYCNNNLPGEFMVYAVSDSKTYIDGDRIVRNDSGWENQSGVRYWPETTVDFYAHVNAGDDNFKWDASSAPVIENFSPAADVADQVDLLYAVKKGESKKDSPVQLNFRHALSQIVFNAKNTNANLYVEIAGVTVANVGGINTFTYPSENTETNIVDGDHDGSYDHTITYDDGSWGKWKDLKSGNAMYSVTFDVAAVPGNSQLVDLTTVKDQNSEFSSKAMLLLPQNTTAWDIENGPAAPADPENPGSYFLVDCAIWNVAGDNVDKQNDVQLWGEDGDTKELAIPVSFNWEQGKKYIYTFVFGDGNGGYNPEPEPDPDDPDPDPEPVLVPIDFEITVDDFVDGGAFEIESGLPTTGE